MVSNYNPDKILRLIKAICTRVGERQGYVNKTKLIKYLYLIDIEYYRNHNETYTGLKWIFYEFGPWAYEYNDLFDEMQKSADFVIHESTHPQYDAHFISTKDKVEIDSIFTSIKDEMAIQRMIDRWADEHLNGMLNYVYFETEPMVDAERYKPLDFEKINLLEPKPIFKLTMGMKDQTRKDNVRRMILEKVKDKREYKKPIRFDPPVYDDIYFEGMELLNKDSEY